MIQGETHSFTLTWPDGDEGRDAIHFGHIAGARAVPFQDGVMIQLPAPFSDVILYSRERLTPAKAARLREAIAHFNASVTKEL
jgi:hypothetical protein